MFSPLQTFLTPLPTQIHVHSLFKKCFFQHKISTAQAVQSLASTSAVIKWKPEAGISAIVHFSLVIACKDECFLVVASCTLDFGVERGLVLH